MFNGAIDRYDWTLAGKREMYVPYNAYRLHGDGVAFDDILKPLHVNPDLLRYELHRVWVVEATLKEGASHIYKRRTMYIDEDSWQILVTDIYDNRDELWRVSEGHVINYYEKPLIWPTLEVHTDLQAGTLPRVRTQQRVPDVRLGSEPQVPGLHPGGPAPRGSALSPRIGDLTKRLVSTMETGTESFRCSRRPSLRSWIPRAREVVETDADGGVADSGASYLGASVCHARRLFDRQVELRSSSCSHWSHPGGRSPARRCRRRSRPNPC